MIVAAHDAPQAAASLGLHLRTPYLFIDSEAYVHQGLDWHGEVLSSLSKLAKSGKVHLLTTSITVREVRAQLDQAIAKATDALRKHSRLLRLAGVDTKPLVDQDALKAAAHVAFDEFLSSTEATSVELDVELEELLQDYFAQKPPFSAKKPSEFPDAIVCASLHAWCRKQGKTAYVVSADPDLKAFCETTIYLFHVEKITDVLTLVNASETLRRAIQTTFAESSKLIQEIESQLIYIRAETPRVRRYYTPGPVSAEGASKAATVNEISSVRVVDAAEDTYTCEVEFNATLTLRLAVEASWHRHDEPSVSFDMDYDVAECFVAIVVVRFDVATSKLLEIVSVEVPEEVLLLDENDIERASA